MSSVPFEAYRAHQIMRGYPLSNLTGEKLTEEQQEQLREYTRRDERSLDCSTCQYNGNGCKYVFKNDRYPIWAGGRNQCRRFMLDEYASPFSWIDGNGEIFTIPDEVVSRIRDGSK